MNPLGASAGLWMLLALGALTISTGLPVWSLLLAVATMFASIGWATGVLDGNILGAMPVRLVGLLESDLLQALPLYVLVGMLLQRLEIADAMFRTLESWLRRTGSGQSLAALALGALIAPMNGSVASSSALLTRLVVPRLHAMDGARATALVSASATIGVIVPPSLVLLLLGDAMLRAHTEATNLPGFSLSQRIINTQDVFHAALLPGCAILALWALCVHWTTPDRHPAPDKIGRKQTAPAVAAMLAILALLGAVFTGRIFPVEAAATGALLLTASALFFHSLNWAQWKQLLGDTLVLTGSLMALLVGATIFSLVFRLFGTDRWIATIMTESTLPHLLAAALALALVGLCSWVLDAFEMIFVVIPIVAPPLIVMLGDAQQTAVLLLLVLQLGFLIPPLGYAVMIARSQLGHNQRMSSLLKALAPFILVQIMAIVGMLWFPAVAHLLDPAAPTEAPESEQEIERQMREMAAPANEGETSPELPGTPQKP